MQRRRRTAEQIRTRIVEVAAQLATERPFPEVSTREIARRAGVQQSVIYRYFPSKGALATEMIALSSSTLCDDLAEASEPLAALQRTHEHMKTNRDLLQIAATERPLSGDATAPLTDPTPPGDDAVWTIIDRIAKHRGVDADCADVRIDWMLAATLISGSALMGDYLRAMRASDGLDADEIAARLDELLSCIVDGSYRRN